MKITYLFREQRTGNYSIEELFGKISSKIAENHEVSNFYCSSADRLKNILEAKKLNSDIFHITGDVNYLSFGLPKSKTILTLHDLGHYEQTLKGYKKLIYRYLWLQLPFASVSKITTISEFTKSRLIQHFNIPESKIQVIHNPAPLHVFRKSEKNAITPIPKILQIGSGHNKNVEALIEAVKDLDVELMLLRKFDAKLKEKLDSYKIKHQFYPSLTYDEVYQKYIECDFVYFASNYEGFGVPILEAQAVGRAIITSTVASMPEVAGDGAHFVDYRSVEEIKAGIVKLIDDESYRNDIVNKGYINVRRFSIESTIDKYLALYESMG